VVWVLETGPTSVERLEELTKAQEMDCPTLSDTFQATGEKMIRAHERATEMLRVVTKALEGKL
jgi:hypothetical protein